MTTLPHQKELLTRLVELLEARIIGGGEPSAKVTLKDLTDAVGELMRLEYVDVGRWISSAKISKPDGERRKNTLKRFNRILRLVESDSAGALEALRRELFVAQAAKMGPPGKYVPLSNPEAPG